MRRVFSGIRLKPRRWSSLFVLGFLVAGVATLHSTIFHRQLLNILLKSSGWKVSIHDSSLKFLSGKVRLTGVSVQDPKGKIDFQAQEVFVGLSPFSLVGGKIQLSRIDVSDPELTIQGGEGGGKKITPEMIDAFFRRFEESSLLKNIVLDQASIHRLHLKVISPNNPEEPRWGEVAEVKLKARSTILSRIDLDVELLDVTGNLPALGNTKRLHLETKIKRDDVRIEDFFWETSKHVLAFKSSWKGGLNSGSFLASGEVRVPSILPDSLFFDVEAAVKDKVASVSNIAVRLPQSTKEAVFRSQGRIEIGDKIEYALPFTARDLELDSIFAKIPSVIVGPAKGTATVDGLIKGTIPELRATARATIHELHHHSLHAAAVTGTLDFHWPELDWNAEIKPGADGRVQGTLKGGIQFRKLPPYVSLKTMLKTLDFRLAGASVSDLIPALETSGTVNGEMHLQGVPGSTAVSGKGTASATQIQSPLGPAEHLNTEITFQPNGDVVFSKTDMQRADISAVFWPNPITLNSSEGIASFHGDPMPGLTLKGFYDTKNDNFTIESFAFKRDGGDLAGTLTYRGGGVRRWSGKVKGLLPLTWLQHLPHYFRDGEGVARLDLSFDGSTSAPNINGSVAFQKSAIEFRNFPSVSDLEGTLTFAGSSLRPQLTGYMGDGRFHLTGSAVTDGLKIRDYDLAFKGTDLTYAKSGVYRIDFDADVTLKGSWPAPRLSGRVDVVDALYSKPFYVRDLILKPFEDPSTATGPGSLDAVTLDVLVKNSGDLKIKNNIAEIYLLADLHVGGTVARPETRGAFTITDGEIRLFGEDFILQEGRLEYIDPSRKEPYLTLKAEQDIPPLYTVEVELKGFLSNLEINLNSTPPLPREDVVSLISTGLTLEELRRSGRSRTSLGTNILANEISSVVERPIAKSTGLDVFRLEASENGSLSKLAVGKNVTDRLTVEFQSDFAPESAQKTIQANYYLTDNILLKGFRSWEKSHSSTTLPPYSVNLSFRVRLY